MDGWMFLLLLAWLGATFGPIFWAWKENALVSLGLVLGLLFGYIVQLIWLFSGNIIIIDLLWMRPNNLFDLNIFTLFTSGFLHSTPMHVLSNIVIIALVGIPLEQRMGRSRWLIIYVIGLLGGSLCWSIANLGTNTPALGASGAAFGILGAYLAGWPKDEVYFPLIIIRPWPVSLIALIYFGLEIVRTYQTLGLSQPSHVGHLAHLGGFAFAYACLNTVAKNGPVPPGETSEKFGPLKELPSEHPFENVANIMEKLYEEGDQKETRQAWMEELTEQTICPVCQGPLIVKNYRVRCQTSTSHLHWP